MKPVEDHVAACLAAVSLLPARDLAPLDALDCLLAEDVAAPRDVPSFDNSAMDGYAVFAADVAGANADRAVELPVVADVAAGPAQPLQLAPGTSARIMTGAPMPADADAVVPVEWTDAGVDRVRITQPARGGAYVRRAGEDVRAGAVVLRAGVRLTPRHVSLLATLGRDRVRAYPRPRVVVISTGSELVPPGKPLGYGQIHDSNGYGLAAAAGDAGALARHVGIVEDDVEAVLATLEGHLADADLLLTSGGVSAGAYDAVKEALGRLGTVRFDRVAMQPGMPQGFGTIGPAATPIFTLPGNPVSSMVSFEVFVRPALRKMWGESDLQRPTVDALAAVDWTSPAGKRQFVRARLERPAESGSEGQPRARPVGGQGSHLVADLAEADCLAVVPEGVTQVRAGDPVRCMLLERTRR